jgi:diadenosine tetraphosphatase ApaH/serine/threonine PP2A family protein phosphatase
MAALATTDIGRFERVALLSDVHGNAVALAAVLDELRTDPPDAICSLGCLTWGPEPRAMLAMLDELGLPLHALRGNGERAVLELADGSREAASPTDEWMVAAHGPEALARVGQFPLALTASIGDAYAVRLCHGSPRSDIELFSPETTPARIAEAFDGVAEPVVVHGHTHLQYVRSLGARTIVGCGSVGIPHTDDGTAAYWTLLDADGPHSMRTEYDVPAAMAAIEASNYPAAPRYLGALREPTSPREIIADAESRFYSD